MTTEYLLEQRILGPHLRLSITEQRYRDLSHAQEVLSDALDFEQRYELLLGNFISMEMAFTEISIRARIAPPRQYLDLAGVLQQASRHVVNVLTAMRGYADQVPQDFKCLKLEPRFSLTAKTELKNIFERSPDYRFMWDFRNYVQHKATALHGFKNLSHLDESKP